MTCIIAFTDGKKVTIVGDSAGSAGTEIRIRKDVKVFSHGEFVFGGTFSFRMLQLLNYCWTPPKLGKNVDLMAYMVSEMVPSIIKVFKDHEFMGKDDEGRADGIGLLVGIRGRIFSIESDFQIAETYESYESIGCGKYLAMGALGILHQMHGTINTSHAISALNIVSKFDSAVSAPFITVSEP